MRGSIEGGAGLKDCLGSSTLESREVTASVKAVAGAIDDSSVLVEEGANLPIAGLYGVSTRVAEALRAVAVIKVAFLTHTAERQRAKEQSVKELRF